MSSPTTGISWDQMVSLIQAQGQQSGLSQDQIDAAIAVAKAEGGYTGTVGDGGTSFGPFQFHLGGELNAFAAWLGVDTATAGQLAISEPQLATQFALQPGGYLYNALQQGKAGGYTGADLAMYAEQFGQRAAAWTIATVGSIWDSLFGKGQTPAPPAGTTTPAPPTTTTPPKSFQPPAVTGLASGLQAISDSLANLGDQVSQAPANAVAAALAPLTSIVRVGEQALWIVVGLALIVVGLWLIVASQRLATLANLAEEA